MTPPLADADLPILDDAKTPATASRGRHVSMLLLAIGIVTLAFALQVRPDQRVELRWLPGWAVPEACSSRQWFGVACPGCGLTRAFIRLREGAFLEAWRFNPASWLLAVAVLSQLPYRSLALLRLGLVEKFSRSAWPDACGWVLIIALIGQWLLKLLQLV